MAEEDKSDNSASQNLSDVEFVTADKHSSDDENNQEVEQNKRNKMLFGEELVEMLGDGAVDLNKVVRIDEEMANQEHAIIDDDRDEAERGANEMIGEKRDSEDSSQLEELSEEVTTNIDVMYSIKARDPDRGDHDVRVLKMSQFFLPDTQKRRKQMDVYNRKIIMDIPDPVNEKTRQYKRELHDRYRKALNKHQRKAKFLPVNPFLEDFYYLQGFQRNGVAPQSNKKPQVPSGYRSLFASHRADPHHHALDRIVPARHHRRPPSKVHPSSSFRTADDGQYQSQAGQDDANKEEQKDFELDACQINELIGSIVTKKQPEVMQAAQAVEPDEAAELTELREKLRKGKSMLRESLAQKMPKVKCDKVEQQSFALLNKLNQFYNPTNQVAATGSTKKRSRFELPNEVEMYEQQIEEQFRQAAIPTKRVKYWGELKNCVSENQKNKDQHLIRRHDWTRYMSDKATFKLPVFSFVSPAAGSTTAGGDQGPGGQQSKDGQVQKPGGVGPPGFPGRPSPIPVLGQDAAGKKPDGTAVGGIGNARLTKRPPPLVVKKSDFDLVTSFEEYEKLKKQESLYYRQRKKTNVTAESIMRHVRWKMGKLSDRDFYRQEFSEIRREEQLEEKALKAAQAASVSARMARRPGMSVSQTAKQLASAEPKDLESRQKPRTQPIDFEENLDVHFDRKRIEIQETILRRKNEKERMSQQKQSTTQTPAYEPIVPVEPKDTEEEHNDSVNKPNQSDDESSSSDSDSDMDDAPSNANQMAGGTTMPSQIAEELNHAQCISDLSYFKLDWQPHDLATFHRPNVIKYFSENQKIPVQAVSTRKEDKETRLDAHLYFKTRLKLSLSKGKFCVFEHIDQHPLFVNNFGMASRLRRYFYGGQMPSQKDLLSQRGENIANRHIGPHGKLLLKQQLEKLDLLGQVDKTRYNGITLLENNMYNAPVFYHRMPSTSNDFFCSIIKQSKNERRIVIRPLTSFYTVGQIEPKREVYNPQSRYFTHFIKTQSKAYTTRLLQENKIMSFHDIRQFFPEIGSPILKKGLKEIEVEQDRSGYCHLNANFEIERHKDRMTPEMICQYESARHGQYRLERLGITEILSADKISYSTHKFCFEETDLILQRVAKLIESEVLQTPWNLSSNYIKIKHEASMMMLEGQGDPSNGHGGYSFLKMPLKISADSIQGAKAGRINLNPAIQNPKAVTGTDADLRKLKKKQLNDILAEAGMAETDLENMSRWEMVAQLRCLASQSAPSHITQNSNTMKSFYARGVRNTSKKQQEMYNKRANTTFRKQMDCLSVPNPKDLHEDSEEEPDFTTLPDLEAMGVEHVANGFGTSLTRPKRSSKEPKPLVQSMREPGANAKDFTRDIYLLVNEEKRDSIVEYAEMPEIKRIEDIKDYLKLFYAIHPTALSAQNQNPSGINIGGVSCNAQFLDAMEGKGGREWEKKLLVKLESREISKKCQILCHKIRSLTWDENKANNQVNAEDLEGDDGEPKKQYERVIFCADEKARKKFNRCMSKNLQRTPKRTNRRTLSRATKPLNAENLKLQAARNRHVHRGNKSGSRSPTSNSVVRQGSASKQKTFRNSQKGDGGSIYSQPTRDQGKVKLGPVLGQGTSQRNMNSGQKPKKTKRKPTAASVAPQQPALILNITNNGVFKPPQPQTQQTMAPSVVNDVVETGDQMVFEQTPRPIQILALPGANMQHIPAIQPAVVLPTLTDQGIVAVTLDSRGGEPALSQPLFQEQSAFQQEDPEEDEGQQSDKLVESTPQDDENNLVNNDEQSNVASEYEPEGFMGEESDEYEEFNDGANQGMGATRKTNSPNKKKKLVSKQKGQPMVQVRQQSMQLLRTQQSSGKLSRRGKTQSSTSKFKPHGFSNDDFEYASQPANKSRRRQQQDGTQSLNIIFMEITEKLMISPNSFLFHNQPTRQDAPNYRDIVKSPIALKDMKNKAKRNEYKMRGAFENDIALMVDNAIQFNGEQHYIAQLAREIEDLAKNLMEVKAGDIETMECIIREGI